MSTQDEKYMQMALKLARRGIGSVEPNPAVGAVIVKANQIIGKGWHKKFGDPHAEINALKDCMSLGVSPQGATMYVALEPCTHHGKTGPCTQAIIEAGLAKVYIATIDPSEHANGAGIKQLHKVGIEVQTGLCETQAKLLNAPFIKFEATGQCWVTLKWAQSIDGKLAWTGHTNKQRWISNELSRKDVHALRRRVGAILVGINTILADDPLLTARPNKGKQPVRIVLDNFLRIPHNCKLLQTAKENPVIICTREKTIHTKPDIAEKITKKGVELLAWPEMSTCSNLHFLLEQLSKRDIAHLLVEGGSRVLSSFLKEDLADEIIVYIAPVILGGSGKVDIAEPMAELPRHFDLHYIETKNFGDDMRLTGLSQIALTDLAIIKG